MCFPATNGNKGVLKRAEEYGAGGPISCQLHWRNWHYSSFLIDYDDDGRADDDRDDTVLLQPNVFANKCTKSECIIIAASLHQKTQSNLFWFSLDMELLNRECQCTQQLAFCG